MSSLSIDASKTDAVKADASITDVSNTDVSKIDAVFTSMGDSTAVLFDVGTTKVYKYRWVILLLHALNAMMNGFQWIQYGIISDVLQKFYGVDSFYIDWLSMIYMLAYIPFIFPASWLMDKMGLRVVTILGALGNCLAAWVKVLSTSPDLYYVTFIGQTIAGITQVFILNAPARLAAVWFPADQVSSACSLGVFGNQFGVALGFLIPPIMVKSHDVLADIGSDLAVLFYMVAGITSVMLILIVFLFREKPPLPPSIAQASQIGNESTASYASSIKALAFNPSFVLLWFAFGIQLGVFNALSTLLNQVVLTYFPDGQEDAGRIGLTMVLAGLAGAVLGGVVLDKTRKFKETTLGVYIFSFIGMVIFTATLSSGYIAVVYVTVGFLGFFMTGYLPIGFELAAELTYPEPEGTSTGMLALSMQILGLLITLLYGWLLKLVGDVWSNIALSCALLLGAVLTALIKPDMRRQAAQQEGMSSASTSRTNKGQIYAKADG